MCQNEGMKTTVLYVVSNLETLFGKTFCGEARIHSLAKEEREKISSGEEKL